MASPFHCSTLLFILFSLLFLSPSQATSKTSSHPQAVLLQVKKDPSTLLYTTQLNQSVYQVPENLTLDLGGQLFWENCTAGYANATQKRAGCGGSSCQARAENTVTGISKNGTLGSDSVSVLSTDGSNPGVNVSASHFLFVCAPGDLLKGLPSGANGMAGLGRTNISLPSLFSSRFKFNYTFAICLTGTTNGTGVVFFGPGSYHFLPNYASTNNLMYTPLLNPPSTAPASSDYFIGVTSIKINQKTVPDINASLLAMDSNGNGGTKISTVTPYTVLQTSIYNAVIKFFKSQLYEVPTVAAVAPFGLCYNSTRFYKTHVGPGVPEIDLVLQNQTVYWAIYGANSMVQVSPEVLCLGFVDGGMNPKTSIVIGGYQLEDNLLQFDLGASMLGFSSSLLRSMSACANFNFTSNA